MSQLGQRVPGFSDQNGRARRGGEASCHIGASNYASRAQIRNCQSASRTSARGVFQFMSIGASVTRPLCTLSCSRKVRTCAFDRLMNFRTEFDLFLSWRCNCYVRDIKFVPNQMIHQDQQE